MIARFYSNLTVIVNLYKTLSTHRKDNKCDVMQCDGYPCISCKMQTKEWVVY